MDNALAIADLTQTIYDAEHEDWMRGEIAPIEKTVNAVWNSPPVANLRQENVVLHDVLNKALLEVEQGICEKEVLGEWDTYYLVKVKSILESYYKQMELNI